MQCEGCGQAAVRILKSSPVIHACKLYPECTKPEKVVADVYNIVYTEPGPAFIHKPYRKPNSTGYFYMIEDNDPVRRNLNEHDYAKDAFIDAGGGYDF
jgi:hypothetical protein